MKKRTIYISLFLIFIIGLVSLIGTFAIDSTITEGTSSKADYLFNITLGDRTNRDILIPSYDSKIVDIKISNPNEFNMSYLLYLEGINSNISIINISDTEVSGILNSKNTNLIKVFIQNNSSSDITTSIKDLVGFEKETLSLPSNSTSINKGVYYKSIVKSNNKDYGKVKPNIKLSTKNGTVKYNIVPNTGYKYKSTTCDGTIVDNLLTISNITSNVNCEVVFEPINVQISLDVAGGNYNISTTYTEAKEHTYTVPYTGTYKLETWGAQGGGYDTIKGGYGGYSVGTIQLNYNTNLYVNVGGEGGSVTQGTISGGYNGGGSAGNTNSNQYNVRWFGSGGGATHIATKSGLLKTLSNSLSSVLIISGGGGGGYYNTSNSNTADGGSAGGYIGSDGVTTGIGGWGSYGTGGTQTEGGYNMVDATTCSNCSSSSYGKDAVGGFGYGGQGGTSTGGGSGYYGGGGSYHVQAAGGGSSYIGNSLLTNKYMYCYNCSTSDATDTKTYTTTNVSSTPTANYAKSGNGAARITLVSTASYTKTYNEKYGIMPTPTRDGYTFGGWYTGENGTGTKINENTAISNTSDHTIYAYWIRNVNVTYNAGYNLFSTSSNSITNNGLTFTYDPSTSYLTINGTPTGGASLNVLTGLTFALNDQYLIKTTHVLGSFKNSGSYGGCFVFEVVDSSNSNVSPRNNLDLGFTTSYAEKRLTVNSAGASNGTKLEYWIWFNTPADWTFTNYRVKVEVAKVETKVIVPNSKYGTMPTPTRAGYTFGGWYTGENGTGTKVDENTVLTNTSDHTLYAKWTANTYTISYNLNGGTKGSSAPTSGTYGNTVTVSNPSKTGYTFNGWTVSGTGASMSGTSLTIGAGNITLTANWTANTYYLDLNGYLDGSSSGGISGYGTADVYINGSLACNDCTDYYTEHPYGTTYSITDIKATGGHAYRGVHSGSLSGTITGTTSVYLSFDTTDTTKPTCSLSLSGSNISASYNDNVGVAYYGWSSSYSGSNSASKSINAGTHTFYVKDTSGNTNTCSITVASTSTSKSCNAEAIKSAKFGSAHGCNVYNGTPSCTYVSGNTCSCVYSPYYSGSNYYYYCCPGGVSADWNNKLPSGLPSCTQSFSSDSYITTTYSCGSGYTKFNNSWCYK